ncbi:glycerophosphodiester phosphodiesterase family protein [Paenarthrobacter aurescens]|uniref:Glycerophosphoryl diester phosphodiesterase n=1 Tax=Paenarthrobacter aurescens TaxID=43663 RepID=A0A4Y3NHL5_PAEAU|nr:glycerophosphodiester phosphodiesterase family protein [Paenarthrobacter aurescens]MDO6142061.1 glycerophosphodiester phosphodiesterase [Paenarthrobacter aurescens]MDO6145864.1 glycerophosphodiester phosphodiesterase [Paenarthrobacter aurescens]MDO6157110.1 glycerophosphodiester phosphodiesterase [Paenarthrobacter aurescens]MDO6161096.1 glycerophosphodiester phosphodiesterase [Paenarthrobacter aurescens]GEB21242.1 glycerophosphoryl diester phosphodiesterase [Paenarthrobacter aurescens]
MTSDDFAPSRPKVYAHRGASAAFAEHTRAAYLRAIADGADGVECDVHLTRDQHVVLLHDANLDRTSTGTGPVGEHTLEQLRALDFSSWKGARIPDAYGGVSDQFLTLPELLDILRAAGRDIGLAIELKHPSPYGLKLEDRVLALLEEEGWTPEESRLENIRISFMSFDTDSVQRLLHSVPKEFICQLVDDFTVKEIRQELGLGFLTGGAVANVMRATQLEAERVLDAGEVGMAGPGIDYVREHARNVQRWLEAGRVFRVWTVDSEKDVALCQGLGIHEITTNKPAQVLAQLMVGSGFGGNPACD